MQNKKKLVLKRVVKAEQAMRPSSYMQRTSGSTQRALRVSVKYTCNATFKHIQRDVLLDIKIGA